MPPRSARLRLWAASLGLMLALPAAVVGQAGAADGEWHYYGGDAGGTRYAPLDQIDRDNVADLEIKWRWSAANFGASPEINSQVTPLMVDGVLYATAGTRRNVVAIDAATGETLWMWRIDEGTRGEDAPRKNHRGVSYWTDGVAERIIYITPGYRLVSLDAQTGRPDLGFGEEGIVDLFEGLDRPRPPDGRIGASSPPMIVGDVAVIGGALSAFAPSRDNIAGFVRGYDVRTGERRWIFHTVPLAGEFGNETWEDDSWRYTGNTAVWAPMSADLDLGYVYLPVETPTNDLYGGDRPGDNLFAESLVALDAETGERVWHFQFIHHGIWDWDIPTAPMLLDVTVDGREIKAVAQVTKQAWTYVFDRETGEPVWPIEERAVPQSAVPGEQTSATQPFPTKPEPFDRQGLSFDDLIDFTPEIKAEAMEIAANYRMGPLYTPPSLINDPSGTKGTLVLPGWGGGSSWPGAAVDAEEGILFVPSLTVPVVVSLAPGDPGGTNPDYMRVGPIYPPGPRGLPLVKPPWGRITAIDLNTGDHLWMRPLGGAPRDVREHPDLQGLGLDFSTMGQNGRPGGLVTKTLLFMGEGGGVRGGVASLHGAGGPTFRAYDKQTGEVVAEIMLPANPTAPPMSYMLDGKQYICVAAATLETPAELIAIALP